MRCWTCSIDEPHRPETRGRAQSSSPRRLSSSYSGTTCSRPSLARPGGPALEGAGLESLELLFQSLVDVVGLAAAGESREPREPGIKLLVEADGSEERHGELQISLAVSVSNMSWVRHAFP